ncbi:hypothetical protein VCPCS023_003763A, partial [Vibrio cholerae O1 str. PCS-023]
MVETQWAGVRV